MYNAVDIDNAKVVWACDMNRSNQDYYRNRKVWLVQPDSASSVTPYLPRPLTGNRKCSLRHLSATYDNIEDVSVIDGKRIDVAMPAYNAKKTLEMTVRELSGIVDIKILVHDSSKDNTMELSRKLVVRTFIQDANYGKGCNQQTCYREALAAGAEVIVTVHPNYQYTPLHALAVAGMISSGVYDMVLASRIVGAGR